MYFRTNAKVERLVGRELITNNTTAIFELVKNSYDAGAKKVVIKFGNFLNYQGDKSLVLSNKDSYIQINDTGKGMTKEEIEKYWMELGTPNKEKNRYQEVRLRDSQIDVIAKRIVNGEKGIGRFGVDKIGSILILESIDENLKEKTKVYFEWDKFNDTSKLIHEIPCEYSCRTVKIGEKPGTHLTIKGLRDMWTWRDIENLKRSLKKFLSPVGIQQDEFNIYFIYEYEENGQVFEKNEQIINDAFDYLRTNIYAELDIQGNLFYEITDNDYIVEEKELRNYNKSPFGAVKIKIYYLDSKDKSVFTKKMGIKTHEYGNIQIFKDNFRILPYGEVHNDWLEIDNRHAQGVFRTFGTRDLVGYIILSHDKTKENFVLQEATDRMGLVEDVPEFEQFKRFTQMIISILENYIFTRIQKQAKETTQVIKNESINVKQDATNLVNDFKDVLDNLNIPQTEKKQILNRIDNKSSSLIEKINTVEHASKEIEKKIKIYSQITSKEGVLYDTLHAIKNKLAIIDAQLNEFQLEIESAKLQIDIDELKIAFDSICKMVERALNKVTSSKLRKTIIPIKQIVYESIESFMPRLKAEDIRIKNLFEAGDKKVRCSFEAIKTNVLENLFDNSVKALKGNQNKEITVLTKVNKDFIEIYFSDNGKGIPEDKIPFIFSLWSSNTGGSGIGLATAKDTLEDVGGEILCVDLGEADKTTTFLIRLPIIY